MPGWINTKEMEIKSISPVLIKSKSNATSIGVYKSDLPSGDKTFTLYFPDVEIISGYADSYNEDTGEAEEFPFDSVGHFYHYTFSASGIEDISFRWSGSTNVEVYTGTYESEADFAKHQLPFNFYNGSAVVYNDEIHILGSNRDTKKHYKWNGTSWTEVSTLPYDFYRGSAVVYNGEIHILGGSGNEKKHYKWNSTDGWTSVSTLPYSFINGGAIVYNDEIHILGGEENETKHYKWDGKEWTEVSTLLYEFSRGSAVVYNGEIHILGGQLTSGRPGQYYYNQNKHYKWNGEEWTKVSDLPYHFSNGSAVVYSEYIYLIGGNEDDKAGSQLYFRWDGEKWEALFGNLIQERSEDYPDVIFSKENVKTSKCIVLADKEIAYADFKYYTSDQIIGHTEPVNNIRQIEGITDTNYIRQSIGSNSPKSNVLRLYDQESVLPYDFYNGSAVAHNNSIYLLGGQDSPTSMIYLQPTYAKVKRAWLLHKAEKSYSEEVSELPYEFSDGAAVVYKDTIHILGSDSPDTTYHYVWDGEGWDSSTPLPYAFYRTGAAVVYKDAIHILGGAATSSRTKHYKWIPYEGWSEVSTIPYSVGSYASAVVYNDEIHVLGGSVNSKYHYKWNGTSWTEVSTLPYTFTAGAAVVYNNEIHILGGGSSSYKHYKWNGEEWVEVSTLPFGFFYSNAAVVYDNEIYIYNDFNAAKWSGEEWIELPEMSHQFSDCSAVVYNDEIHILGRIEDSLEKHYKIVNKGDRIPEFLPTVYARDMDNNRLRKGLQMKENWIEKDSSFENPTSGLLTTFGGFIDVYYGLSYFVSATEYSWGYSSSGLIRDTFSAPYNTSGAAAVYHNSEIHLLGGSGSTTIAKYHYKGGSGNWTKLSNLPYNFVHGCAVSLNGEIHILGCDAYPTRHYKWNGSSWTSVSVLPHGFSFGSATVYNNEIYIIGGYTLPSSSSIAGLKNGTFYPHVYKWNSTDGWVKVIDLPDVPFKEPLIYHDDLYAYGVFWNDHLHIFGGYWTISGGGTIGPSTRRYYSYHYELIDEKWISRKTARSINYGVVVNSLHNKLYTLGGKYSVTELYASITSKLDEYEFDDTVYN